LRLHARFYGRAAKGSPVICIPGLTRNCRDFEDLAPWIAESGRQVLAVDLRGRGQSERDGDVRRYAPPIYARDIAELLRAIDATRAIFVGTSLGGIVTMTIAARTPRLVAASVLNDVGPRVGAHGLARIATYVGKNAPVRTWDEARSYAHETNGYAFPNYGQADWEAFARRLFTSDKHGAPVLDYDPKVFRAANRAPAWFNQWLAWRAFKALSQCGPVLIVRGALSDILEPKTVARMQSCSRHVSAVEVANVGHAPMLDEPEAREAIRALLAKAA